MRLFRSTAQPPKLAVPLYAPAPAPGASIRTVVGLSLLQFATVKEALTIPNCPLLAMALTSSRCGPLARVLVSTKTDHPTFGQPGRPGNAAQTSGRASP